ncbi:hypothetical protein ACFL9T_05630 [Thermodesulfobacteriota bacterium]
MNRTYSRIKENEATRDGILHPIMDTDKQKRIGTDNVIVAAGQKIELDILKGLQVSLNKKGTVSLTEILWLGVPPAYLQPGTWSSIPEP